MALYKDSNGNLHDDMDGIALLLPCWPVDCVPITDDEAAQIHGAQSQQVQSMVSVEVEVNPID